MLDRNNGPFRNVDAISAESHIHCSAYIDDNLLKGIYGDENWAISMIIGKNAYHVYDIDPQEIVCSAMLSYYCSLGALDAFAVSDLDLNSWRLGPH